MPVRGESSSKSQDLRMVMGKPFHGHSKFFPIFQETLPRSRGHGGHLYLTAALLCGRTSTQQLRRIVDHQALNDRCGS